MAAPADDDVFELVVGLVARGEYLDEIPGVAQPATEGGGPFKVLTDGTFARVYSRNSEEFIAAKSAGLIEPLPTPPYPPASPDLLAEAEDVLGRPLPPLLRRLYAEVANGGFGPGYGLLGLGDGHGMAPDGTAMERYLRYQDWEDSHLQSLFPVCDWGCAISSFVDCSDPATTMWGLDPNPVDDVADALFRQEMGFTEWLWLWVEGRLYQPWVVEDPETGEWRCSTNGETAAVLSGDW